VIIASLRTEKYVGKRKDLEGSEGGNPFRTGQPGKCCNYYPYATFINGDLVLVHLIHRCNGNKENVTAAYLAEILARRSVPVLSE
jgi:hypothetical protein